MSLVHALYESCYDFLFLYMVIFQLYSKKMVKTQFGDQKLVVLQNFPNKENENKIKFLIGFFMESECVLKIILKSTTADAKKLSIESKT